MRPDLRKIWVVASTEFGSAVRTKSFIIGILLLPLLMAGMSGLQILMADRVDTRPRNFVVVDRSGWLYPTIEKAAAAHNAAQAQATGKAARPRFEPTRAGDAEAGPELALELSGRVRKQELDAFVVIPAGVAEPPPTNAVAAPAVEYHSNNPNDMTLRGWLGGVINTAVRARRFAKAGIDQAMADRLGRAVEFDNLGLLERDPASGTGPGAIRPARKIDPVRTMAAPAVLMFVMYFVIMSSAPQLLNSVIEEKMSRISEVLLGSLTPFELMMGKLLGNTGIAMVLAVLYIGGAYGFATYKGYGDIISPWMLAALALFLVLAILLYGSLYTATGAACNELKDAQSLMMPVLLLSMFPLVFWMGVLRDPASPLSVGMSLFPPASPFLMLLRMALNPAPPAWQVILAVVLTTLTATATVWAAGKIFRTGLLMQGKAPSFAELARWITAR